MKLKFSVQLQLTIIILALLLTFGATLGWFHHKQTSNLFLTSSKELFEQVAEDISDNFLAEYGPVSTTVRLLTLSPLVNDNNLAARLSRLPVLSSVLESSPEIVALSVGYSDAEYFIIRSLNSSYMINRFGAPDEARYVVDNIEREQGQPEFSRFFYDKNLNLLAERDMGYTSYNPTVRPWYRLAVYTNDVAVTTPYLFYFIGKVGVTVVKQEPESANVFAADITLDSLSNTLIRNRVSHSSQMLLYTSENDVIASLEPETIVVSAGDDSLSISKLSRLNNAVVMDFFQQQPQPNDSHFFLDSGGARWIGINKPLTLVGFTANLLILAPEAELLAEAYVIRQQATVITVIIILVSLLIALVAARKLAQPLQRLVNETTPIINFDFSQQLTADSKINDIHQLQAALEVARKTSNGLGKLIDLLNTEATRGQLIPMIAAELLTLTDAEGILLYHVKPQSRQLIPECFKSRSGVIVNHNCPPLPLADESLALVKAYKDNTIQAIGLNQDIADKMGVHGSLLNYLAAEQLIMVVINMVNQQGDKSGLLCLLFKDEAANCDYRSWLNDHRKSFYQSLATICGVALETQSRPEKSNETVAKSNQRFPSN